MKSSPSIHEILSKGREKESRKKLMLGDGFTSPITEQNSILTTPGHHPNSDNWQRNERSWCDHSKD